MTPSPPSLDDYNSGNTQEPSKSIPPSVQDQLDQLDMKLLQANTNYNSCVQGIMNCMQGSRDIFALYNNLNIMNKSANEYIQICRKEAKIYREYGFIEESELHDNLAYEMKEKVNYVQNTVDKALSN